MKNKKNSRKGVALISVLSLTAIALVIITVVVVVTIINSQIGFDQYQAQKTYEATEAVLQDGILRFLRDRVFINPYSQWTQNCLQIQNFVCKMELNLTESGGTIEAWGKINNKLKHLQTELIVTENENVSISSKKEIY